jgi:hypothetical protein
MTDMISVVNRKKPYQVIDPAIRIYIGRPSILGNPFRTGDGLSRIYVIESYRRYLREQFEKRNQEIIQALKVIRKLHEIGYNVYLECFCSPDFCHGDVVKEVVLNMRVDESI